MINIFNKMFVYSVHSVPNQIHNKYMINYQQFIHNISINIIFIIFICVRYHLSIYELITFYASGFVYGLFCETITILFLLIATEYEDIQQITNEIPNYESMIYYYWMSSTTILLFFFY